MDFVQIENVANELINRNSLKEIHAALVRSGIAPTDAAKAIVFVPSAFAREVFEPQGIEFPTKFATRGPDGKTFVEREYTKEHIYTLARKVARSWIESGRSMEVQRILAWTAEFKLISEAKARGLTPARMSQMIHEF